MATGNSKLLYGIVIPAIILSASGALGLVLYQWRDAPSKKPKESSGVAVETVTVHESEHTMDVTASGTVVPARQLDVRPQVSGRIVWLHESLDPGTFVDEGQTLYRIDPTDYRTAISELEAAVEQARAQLTVAESRHRAASDEWEQYQQALEEEGGQASALALREPQLDEAKARLEGAKARLERARNNAGRTRFRAPFGAVITASDAEIGQLVGPETRITRLVGTETFRARVSVRTDRLPYIAIPGIDGAEGADVIVRQPLGDRQVERPGRVLGLLSDRDATSRMARLMVQIDDPYGLDDTDEEGGRSYPVLLNTFVEVAIEGRRSERLVELPREGLRHGDDAFVVGSSEQLDIRELEVAWRRADSVLVSKGLSDGDRVVISPIATPVDGMQLRVVESTNPQDELAREDHGE